MKKIIKTILYALLAIAILASIGGNIYYFGYKQLEANLMQKGFNLAIGQVMQTVQKTGEVQITKDLILIKKPNATQPAK